MWDGVRGCRDGGKELHGMKATSIGLNLVSLPTHLSVKLHQTLHCLAGLHMPRQLLS